MKICVSPTKTMKCEIRRACTSPIFEKEAKMIFDVMKNYDVNELKKLYRCNDKIAQENYQRFQTIKESGNALFSYTGLQFKNMDVNDFDEADLNYAQDHLCILSGLYGLLRPMDEVHPYRLDLENKIAIPIEEYYQDKIRNYLKDEQIIDCTSKEYSAWLNENKIRIEFKVKKNDLLKTEATASKMARGRFVHYCIKNKIESIEALKQFHELDYHYDETLSNESMLVFVKGEER